MRCLGLSIEGKSIKLALVSKVKNRLTIEQLEELQEIPMELLQEKNLSIVTGLPAADLIRREVSLKLTRSSAVFKTLPFQLENLLPFSLEETLVHPFLYPQKDKTDVVAFATTRLALKKHLADLQDKKIDPDQVSCVPIALARFARFLFSEPSLSWVHQKTAVALEGEKIVFTQSLDDESRLEMVLKNKYGHYFQIPSQLPSLQNYSSDQLLSFATAIGLALDGLHDSPCQFRQNDFISQKKRKKEWLFKLGTFAACVSLTLLVGTIGQWMLYRKETGLKERISTYFSSPGSLEDQITAWQKKLAQEGQEFSLLPDVPSVRDVLAWLGTFQEPIEVVHFHYGLVQYPRVEDKAKPYQVKIDLEFTAPSPASAHRFQQTLEKAPTLIDKKHKVTWTEQKESYKLSFVLRKI